MSRGDLDPGGGSGAWSGQEKQDQQKRLPLTSYGASEDHLPSDTSTDSDTGGGFDTRLREGSLELRMQQVEDELRRKCSRWKTNSEGTRKEIMSTRRQLRGV